MVSQVTVIGILMIVNGALCVLFGLLLMVLGSMMGSIFRMQGNMPVEAQQQLQGMSTFLTVLYIALGALNAGAGAVNIFGGIHALRFRSRTFVIVALFLNVLCFISIYCLPTSLGVMIWGLIVLFNREVGQAFVLGSQGLSADDIKDRMRRPYRRDDDFDDRRGFDRDEPDAPPPSPRGPGDDGIRKL